MKNPFDLSGKKVLLAGGASEAGVAIAAQLGLLGASLILVDDSAEKLQQAQKQIPAEKPEIYAFDMFDVPQIENHLKVIASKFGPFHGFVYAAGTGGTRPLSFTKPAFVNEMMNANLNAFIEMVRCLTKKNIFVTGGSIVAISSVSSIRGLKSKTAYSASKAALDAAVRCMAAELSEKKIRVNSILKGWVTSDMEKDFIKDNMVLGENDDFKRQVLGPIKPVEIGNTVAFLLSDAVKTITGSSVLLDGGYTL